MDTSGLAVPNEIDDCEIDLLGCRAKKAWYDLSKGHVVYNLPAQMKVGREERIEVIIAGEIIEDLTQYLAEKGKFIKLKNVQVSPEMEVHLEGKNDFKVYPISPLKQAIIEDSTEWVWKVIPISNGSKKLTLSINAVLEIRGFRNVPRTLCDNDKEINVKVNTTYQLSKFIVKYWRWICTTILAMIGIIISWIKLT